MGSGWPPWAAGEYMDLPRLSAIWLRLEGRSLMQEHGRLQYAKMWFLSLRGSSEISVLGKNITGNWAYFPNFELSSEIPFVNGWFATEAIQDPFLYQLTFDAYLPSQQIRWHNIFTDHHHIFPSFPCVSHSLSCRSRWTNGHEFW